MDSPSPFTEPDASIPPRIVEADELDSSGSDISTPIAQTASPKPILRSPSKPAAVRPILCRDGSAPAPPPAGVPPAIPSGPNSAQNQGVSGEEGLPTDSLSLLQLRRLVTDLPKFEPKGYAYVYADTRGFGEEVEEWFGYSEEENYVLLKGREAFEFLWKGKKSWMEAGDEDKEQFVKSCLAQIGREDSKWIKPLEALGYVALGVWGETAGLEKASSDVDEWQEETKEGYAKSKLQMMWMRNNVGLLCRCGSAETVFTILRRVCESEQDANESFKLSLGGDEDASAKLVDLTGLIQSLTILYLFVEIGRRETNGARSEIRESIANLEPDLLHFLTQLIAKFRWEESPQLPTSKILLLYWKTILLLFGGSKELKESKAALREESDADQRDHDERFITASPLDYHLFRQEITSKYPSYNPPPPLVPIEEENNSILPPLPNHPSRRTSQESLHRAIGPNNNAPSSIFNQPVHIATPAPSPPPSPAGPGGKGGKKQNYQTNQNFPFLYPPLDGPNNVVGGKGSAELQDQRVGKRWEGGDVPASIVEAGQLFASRMRMSRSIRQLWSVREKYIKHERGWDELLRNNEETSEHSEIDEESEKVEPPGHMVQPVDGTEDLEVQRRLDAIEKFYRNSLPYLQSVVLVLWKIAFGNVSALVSQTNGPNGLPFPDDNPENAQGKRKMNISSATQNGLANGDEDYLMPDASLEELNATRSREISAKAISGILLMLLKWFRLSHILKYEYVTQLLLDANYLPLILKLFAHQDIDRAVDQKIDRDDLDFFYFCHVNSTHPPSPPQEIPSPAPSSPDSAAPPPIPTHRRSRSSPESQPPSPPLKPEVDELGYPTTTLPQSPLTTYSPRFFFTTITLLRLLQKITKRHAHRSLLLVQYKSSTILRRTLKIPQPELRLYTLKLFKHQVPFCGRKWRQSNMRVITAVYLHVGPELRDEWLSGGDVDGVVEEAVPVEQGWRSLVHWWHLRFYRRDIEGLKKRSGGAADDGEEGAEGEGSEEGEYNFFARELERMGWGAGGSVVGDDEEDEEKGEERVGGNEWEGGPLALEGWT
ncbi:MAG: hypothetical protein LQ342_007832 [Letrouitia transgressa]|nr:MAG: hypothetical protein LQ342_007832 [Letrouitia transgressa]